MPKVWLVSSGSYSDYGISAAFSTQELAEAYTKHANGPDELGDYQVEEYDLDVPREQWPGAWCAIITGDGDQLSAHWETGVKLPGQPLYSPHMSWGTYKGPLFYGYGETPEHARRSAEELRRQTKALSG